MSPEAIYCRLVREEDFPGIMAIQAEHYSGYFLEPVETLHARWLASPDTAWVAMDENGICAYLFGYRSFLGKVTALHGMFEIAESPNTLYLHDLAVSQRAAYKGIGTRLVRLAWELARHERLPYSSLVSLAAPRWFWDRLGYREYALYDAEHLARLNAYSEPVFYMTVALDA